MLTSDIETDGLLEDVSKFHCGVSQDYFTGEIFEYGPNDLLEYIRQLECEAAKPNGLIVFHNGIKYDIPVLDKLKRALCGKRLNIPRKKVLDTLVLSRLIHANLRDTDAGLLRSGRLPGNRYGSHALEAWGYRLGEMKGEYKDDFIKAVKARGEVYVKGSEWAQWSPEMQAYCVQDVVVTTKLLTKLMSDPYYFPTGTAPNSENWSTAIHAVHLEHDTAWTLAQMERNGFPFNQDAAERLYGDLAAKRSDLLVTLIKTFGSWYEAKGGTEFFRHPVTGKDIIKWSDGRPMPRVKYPKTGGVYLKDGKKKDTRITFEGAPYTPVEFITFNPASGKHLIRVLQLAGWTPTEFTNKGAPKVDDETLEGVTVDDPQAQMCIALVRDYLMIQKRIGMLAEGDNAWLRLVSRKTGFMHGSINPNGAVTGRATHSYPNMGQVPSGSSPYGPECRSLFGAMYARHLPGWSDCVQVGVDASGLELRCLGHFGARFDAGAYADQVLNGDVHWANGLAAGIIPPGTTRDKHNEQHEAWRGNAKTFIYAFLYGAGDVKIGSIVGGGAKRGKELKKAFLEGTPVIADLRGSLEESLIAEQKWNQALRRFDIKWKRRWIKGLDGRKIHVRSPHSALNTLLQSAGALVCKAWVVGVEEILMEQGLVHGWDGDFCFMAWVHDELQIAARTPEVAEKVHAASKLAISRVATMFNFRCPLDTDGKTGPTWRECH